MEKWMLAGMLFVGCVIAQSEHSVAQTGETAMHALARLEPMNTAHFFPPAIPEGIEPSDYGLADGSINAANWHLAPEAGKVLDGDNTVTSVEAAPLKAVDVFALYPTSWSRQVGEPYVCAVDCAEMRQKGGAFINGKISAFKAVANIYAPYYRQLDAAWALGLDRSIVTNEKYFGGIPYVDVRAAFKYYLDYCNPVDTTTGKRRPFILASHSQGSAVMKCLLKEFAKKDGYFTDAAYANLFRESLIAAYVVGFTVTDADLEAMGLPFAQRADDVGVVLSWNTESPALAAGSAGINPILPKEFSTMKPRCINPLNWEPDTVVVPTVAIDNPGSVITSPVVDPTAGVIVPGALAPESAWQKKVTALLKKDRGTLITEADPEIFHVRGTEIMFPKGCFHLYEYDFYYKCIAENAQTRIRAYFNARKE